MRVSNDTAHKNPLGVTTSQGAVRTNTTMITEAAIKERAARDARLDADLPEGRCADCFKTFAGRLLDDNRLCMECDIQAYTKASKAERAAAEAEDLAEIEKARLKWDRDLFEEGLERAKYLEAEWAAENPWEALKLRERTVKDREITRRETRQDAYDADADAPGLAEVEPDWEAFYAFTMKVERASPGKLPAILTRTDGRTIFYAQKVNTCAARPNGGKSWVAIKCAIEVVERGGRVLMLDFDNKRPSVLAGRAQDMAVERIFQNEESFQFQDVALVTHPGAMSAAVQWLLAAKDPIFSTVIVDSDTAAGVPNDGGDAYPWWKTHVTPWETAELGVLILSHQPKLQDDNSPPGPIGSTTKRAMPTGAVLTMKTTKMWNNDAGGLVHLTVDKDRNGELPGVEEDTIVDMVVEHVGPEGEQFLNITLEPPDPERGSEDLAEDLDAALANHPEGVYSQKAVRALVKGNGKTIGMALKSLVEDGHVITEKVEGKRGFIYKSALFQD